MPRFYFHLFNKVNVHDDLGQDLPDLDVARTEATQACRNIMAEDVRTDGEITLSHRIEIEEEDGGTALVLPFRACLEIRP